MRKEPTNEASSFSFRGKLLLGIIFLSIIIPTVGGFYLVRETTNSLKDVISTKSVAFTTTLARQIKPALEFDDNETAKEISDAITLNSFIRGVRVWKLDIFEPEKKPTLFTESFDSDQNQSLKFKLIIRLKKYIQTQSSQSKTFVTINCGANINFDRLRHISERAEVGQLKEALFAVNIPEKTGSFREFCKIIGKRSITEFNYRYSNKSNATIFVGIELKDGNTEKDLLLKKIKQHNYDVIDLTNDEMTKLHIRHMVGGNNIIKNECLYRFQFPERPGALINFLDKLGSRFNISLFHYRNHGAAFGRVLAGVQVAKKERPSFKKLLDEIGFRYSNETENPAYKLFLSNNHCQI